MKTFIVVCEIILFLGFSFSNASSKRDFEIRLDDDRRLFKVPLVSGQIKIDAYLDEPHWQDAVEIEANIEVRPGENIPAPVKTKVLLAHSETHIYVAFIAHDPDPRQIRARYCDRDQIWDDDWVLILFDTFNDQRRTYDFGCNPYGIQTDFIETPTGGGGEWDAIWESNGRIFEEGYIVEMAIPFRALNFPAGGKDQIWGFDAVRSYPRNVRHHIGAFPRDRNNNCYMCQSHKLQGFAGVTPGRNLQITPTFSTVLSQERVNETSGGFQNSDERYEPGVTASWGITPNLGFSGTLNPDFSNIEADILQLDINNQFAIYYPEKRPFFLENSDFFSTPLNMIHTRTLADPDWGVKLSGKQGNNTLGLFTAQDRITNYIFPGAESSDSYSQDKRSYGTALRYKRDISNSSNLGILFTDREGDEYHNRLGGIDGDLKFTPKDRLMFQVVRSSTAYSDSLGKNYGQLPGDISDNAYYFQYSHNTRDYNFYGKHKQVDPEFRADLGFITQAGYKYNEVGASYKWQKDPGHWFTWLQAAASYDYMRDSNDQLIHRVWSATLLYQGPYDSHARFYTEKGKDRYNGVEFRTHWMDGCAGFRPWAPVFFHIYWRYGDQIDYANTRLGKRLRIFPSLNWAIGLRLRIESGYNYERLDVNPGRLYEANVGRLKVVYQFNKRLFVRNILQYKFYDRNPALYEDEINDETQKLFNQFLLSYKINPHTVFFLGYSDDYYGDQVINFTQTNRTVFAKLGYAWSL